jgi:hypothetical protein
MFVGKAGAYPSVEKLKCTSLGHFPTNIGLGWTGLPETNTLAYYKNIYNIGPRMDVISQNEKHSSLLKKIISA